MAPEEEVTAKQLPLGCRKGEQRISRKFQRLYEISKISQGFMKVIEHLLIVE
jgi:hypothetical protein